MSMQSQWEPQGLGYIPMVIEQSGRWSAARRKDTRAPIGTDDDPCAIR